MIDGKPARFDLQEFAMVTRLNFCEIPTYKERQHKKNEGEAFAKRIIGKKKIKKNSFRRFDSI